MKELSIEEKAKAYDEALEKARQIHDADRVSGIELITCEEIFPELQESENERMIKSISRLINHYYDVNFPTPEGLNRKDLLDWINKQSEQEPNKILDSSKLKPDPNPYWTKSPEYQLASEQKPAEWSEEDKNMLQSILDEYKSMPAEKRNWLKSLKNRVQPKQEWNEEDDKMINSIVVHLNATTCGFPEDRAWADKFINWLKSIKDKVQPQPKREWNEEDEQYLEDTLTLLEGNRSIHTYGEVKKWLKSLKPQSTWKPSDEQINTLWDAIVYVESFNSNFKGSGSVLEKLYNDLKKLKE